jgi:hypothetical protein
MYVESHKSDISSHHYNSYNRRRNKVIHKFKGWWYAVSNRLVLDIEVRDSDLVD